MDLHGKIMNIHPMMNDQMYKLGHRDARHAAAELALADYAALQQSHAELPEVCTWQKQEKSKRWWTTGCGESWMFEEWESPGESRMNFCPRCGKKLVVPTTAARHDNTHDGE